MSDQNIKDTLEVLQKLHTLGDFEKYGKEEEKILLSLGTACDILQSVFLATHGKEFWLVLWNLEQAIRNYLKHGHDFKTADEALEWVREQIPESIYEVV